MWPYTLDSNIVSDQTNWYHLIVIKTKIRTYYNGLYWLYWMWYRLKRFIHNIVYDFYLVIAGDGGDCDGVGASLSEPVLFEFHMIHFHSCHLNRDSFI